MTGRDTGIADRLRARGLTVVEVAGWQTRGSASFDPKGSIDHHTAGPLAGNAPSLGVCINGRPGIPGPLANVLVGRDNTCYVIAAGRANHGGVGTWQGLSGNTHFYGVERENVGTGAEPWTPAQHLTAGLVHAALIGANGNAELVVRHADYATPHGRKTDAYGITTADLQKLVTLINAQVGQPAPVPVEQDTRAAAFLRGILAAAESRPVLRSGDSGVWVNDLQTALNAIYGRDIATVDGRFGPATQRAVQAFQRSHGLTVDGIVGVATWCQLLAARLKSGR